MDEVWEFYPVKICFRIQWIQWKNSAVACRIKWNNLIKYESFRRMLACIKNVGQRETSGGSVKKFHLVQFCIEVARCTLDGDKQASRTCIGESKADLVTSDLQDGCCLIQGICKLCLIKESIERSLVFSVAETMSVAREVVAETREWLDLGIWALISREKAVV